MLCRSLLYSRVTQFYTYIRSFLNILFHYGLSQEIGYSSLCYTVRPCCLSILNVIVCIYQPQIPSPFLSLHPSPLATASLISTSVSLKLIIFLKSKTLEGIRKISLLYFSVNYFIRLLSSKHLVHIQQPFRLEGEVERPGEGQVASFRI